jgi:hypothetical protein
MREGISDRVHDKSNLVGYTLIGYSASLHVLSVLRLGESPNDSHCAYAVHLCNYVM